jgi:hypothetical protein
MLGIDTFRGEVTRDASNYADVTLYHLSTMMTKFPQLRRCKVYIGMENNMNFIATTFDHELKRALEIGAADYRQSLRLRDSQARLMSSSGPTLTTFDPSDLHIETYREAQGTARTVHNGAGHHGVGELDETIKHCGFNTTGPRKHLVFGHMPSDIINERIVFAEGFFTSNASVTSTQRKNELIEEMQRMQYVQISRPTNPDKPPTFSITGKGINLTQEDDIVMAMFVGVAIAKHSWFSAEFKKIDYSKSIML